MKTRFLLPAATLGIVFALTFEFPLLSAAEASAPAAKVNRLAKEKSPYLRQHASNPVDWYPWGEEAFEAARRENKPIFLSIGYSTCHWCHVMERESFSNPELAAQLNAGFICIKVDREERPDVDRVYMTFVQALNGEGGWPLSVWLTPDLKPFFGGTYFAPEDRGGQPGFKTMLTRISELWRAQHEEVLQRAEQMLGSLRADTQSAPAGAVAFEERRAQAFRRAAEDFDAENGGFERAPKFPQPSLLELLVDVAATSAEPAQREKSLAMLRTTLRALAQGGIHDQLGGGFHRYSVDAKWRVPHFEKMLYDQAQLVNVSLSAWQLSGDDVLLGAARDTLAYVQRVMTSPEGAFYSAEDADSLRSDGSAERSEGAFYVWTEDEIKRVLGDPERTALFVYAFGVESAGNAAGEFPAGSNVLYRAHSIAECADRFKLSEAEVLARLDPAKQALLAAREARPRPALDDKVLTAWNGLMISAFARAAQAMGEPVYATRATRAAEFLRTHLYDATTGRLARSWRAGTRDQRGFAEDYAFLISGLIDLYEATFDVQWLEWALKLQEKQIELFYDAEHGGFFANAADDPTVVLRLKEDADNAEPAASSVSVRNLARLGALLHRDDFAPLASRTAQSFAAQFERAPSALPYMLVAAGWLQGSPQQIIIAGDAASEKTRNLVREVWRRCLPRHVLIRVDAKSRGFFSSRMEVVADLPEIERDAATAYVCRNYVCQLPTSDPAALGKQLEPVK